MKRILLILVTLSFTSLSRPASPYHEHLSKEQIENAIQGFQDLKNNQDKQAFFVDSHLIQLEDGTLGLYLEEFEDLLMDISQMLGLLRPACSIIADAFNISSNGAPSINREQSIQGLVTFVTSVIEHFQMQEVRHGHSEFSRTHPSSRTFEQGKDQQERTWDRKSIV